MPINDALTCMCSHIGGAAGLCKLLAAARPGWGSAAAVAVVAAGRGCLGLGHDVQLAALCMLTGNAHTCMRSHMGGAAGLGEAAIARPGWESAAAVAVVAAGRSCLGLGLMCSSLPSPSQTRFAGSAAVAFKYTAAPLTQTGKGCLVCTSPTCTACLLLTGHGGDIPVQLHGI